MTSFFNLFESVSRQPMDGDRAVTTFLKQDTNFWKTLAHISNSDPEGLASILKIKPAVVSTWFKNINQVEQRAVQVKSEKIKSQMLPTGNR